MEKNIEIPQNLWKLLQISVKFVKLLCKFHNASSSLFFLFHVSCFFVSHPTCSKHLETLAVDRENLCWLTMLDVVLGVPTQGTKGLQPLGP